MTDFIFNPYLLEGTMPKIDITEQEHAEILSALDLAHKSAVRAQNTSRLPQLREIWATQERSITNTINKLKTAFHVKQ